ncbi:hypothetical protein [Anthocerotibacter panamensis]|uniref:hypothetical protein n=1 Tax=Anthocerotibacter panamensis TaxID=2857077 RepID=UPI001C406120|nr:hypothetical protein [Anthocerotibacter panamensis]
MEPEDETYQKILLYATNQCSLVLLVVRSPMLINSNANKALDSLKEFLQREFLSSEWPGTILLSGTAKVYHYTYNSDCLKILAEITDKLYNWQHPDLPEDLSFLRSDGEPWLVSISHERDSYLYLSEEEVTQLISTIPEISSMILRDDIN